jgi:hypothetical protein
MPEPGVDRKSLIERGAQALYDLREHQGVRPPVSTWPPNDPDEAEDYRMEARAVLAAVDYRGAVARAERLEAALRQIAANRPLDLTAQEIAERALDVLPGSAQEALGLLNAHLTKESE